MLLITLRGVVFTYLSAVCQNVLTQDVDGVLLSAYCPLNAAAVLLVQNDERQ